MSFHNRTAVAFSGPRLVEHFSVSRDVAARRTGWRGAPGSLYPVYQRCTWLCELGQNTAACLCL